MQNNTHPFIKSVFGASVCFIKYSVSLYHERTWRSCTSPEICLVSVAQNDNEVFRRWAAGVDISPQMTRGLIHVKDTRLSFIKSPRWSSGLWPLEVKRLKVTPWRWPGIPFFSVISAVFHCSFTLEVTTGKQQWWHDQNILQLMLAQVSNQHLLLGPLTCIAMLMTPPPQQTCPVLHDALFHQVSRNPVSWVFTY